MLKACLAVILKNFCKENDEYLRNLNPENTAVLIEKLTETLTNWKNLFKKLIVSSETELYSLAVIEDLCIENPLLFNFYNIILQILYDEEFSVFSDNTLRAWSATDESRYATSEGFKSVDFNYHGIFVQKTKKFIDAL